MNVLGIEFHYVEQTDTFACDIGFVFRYDKAFDWWVLTGPKSRPIVGHDPATIFRDLICRLKKEHAHLQASVREWDLLMQAVDTQVVDPVDQGARR
jgi:hypothetical protein